MTEKNELKICDFGWSVGETQDFRNTFCGTYEFMAPEILSDKGYDKRVDIWSLGILLYELIHGYSPFRGKKMMVIFNNIKSGHFKFKSGVSSGIKELIRGILKADVNQRMTIDEIKNHWVVREMIFGEPRNSSNTQKNTKNNLSRTSRER